jgi:3'-5' exonuclease
MASFLILDIETIPDPDLPSAQSIDGIDRVPAAPHNQIVCIGALQIDSGYQARKIKIIGNGLSESGMVNALVNVLFKYSPTIVTFNGRGFDMPVIAARCLRYGIPFRSYYQNREMRYRYSTDGHFDIMDYVSDFGATKPAKLDTVAKLCGMPGKVGVAGSDVAAMVTRGELDAVKAYCLCDVAQTAGVFLRVQLVRGEIDRAQYLSGMQSLISMIRANPDLEPLAGALDESRLMLKSELDSETVSG